MGENKNIYKSFKLFLLGRVWIKCVQTLIKLLAITEYFTKNVGIEVAPIVKQNDSVTADSPRLAYFNSFFFLVQKRPIISLKNTPKI